MNEFPSTKFPTLYAFSRNGKVKEWSIQAFDYQDDTAAYTTTHGYMGGKLQSTTQDIQQGKNLGRANETTSYEQAVSEAQSKWNKKKDEGYVENYNEIPNAADVERFLPMLAHRFDKRAAKIKWPAYAQPKLDGARCLARKDNGKVIMWSRKGKLLEVPTEIRDELSIIMSDGDCLDGELYVHGWTFQRIISAVKARKPDTALLEYHVYDAPVKNKTFLARFANVYGDAFQRDIARIPGLSRVKFVETTRVKDRDEAEELFAKYIADGYEGLMVRNINGKYNFGHRSVDLQKIKEFEDAEFVIVGGKEASGRDVGTVVFRCRAENEKYFDVRPKGTREQRKEWWDNLDDLVGQKLTVRFQGRSEEGTPRFPVGLHIRPDWDLGE